MNCPPKQEIQGQSKWVGLGTVSCTHRTKPHPLFSTRTAGAARHSDSTYAMLIADCDMGGHGMSKVIELTDEQYQTIEREAATRG